MPYSHSTTSHQGYRNAGNTDAQLLQAAHNLVDLYLMYLRDHETGSDLFDTQELPAEKERLVNAFRVVIATESRTGVRALLIKAGMTLAQFQDDVGARMSVRPAGLGEARNGGDHRPEPSQLRRVDLALMRLGEDRARLMQVFRAATDIAEHKPYHHA